jgi:hypothetical protein
MPKVRHHRCLITHKPNTLTADQVDLFVQQAFNAQAYSFHTQLQKE